MIYLRTLGTAEIDVGDLRITPLAVRKFALLLRLGAEPGRRVPRDVLRELVFPDLADRNARHSLRDLIYQFRQAGVVIEADKDGVTLVSAGSDYRDLIESAEPTTDQLRAAQNGFLPGYATEHSEAFSEWFAAFRARTILDLCRVLTREMDRAKRLGDWLRTEHIARACLELDSTHEEANLALVETVAASGSKAEALRMLDQYVRDLGVHHSQLKVPIAIVRKRISERVRENYRTDLSLPFLGRTAEMLAVNQRFEMARSGESQCIVLAGEAGIGKSRLAEELCTQATLSGALVQYVATQPHDVNRPMATLADLVPQLLQLPGAIGCSPESMAALRRLTTHDESASTSPDVQVDMLASSISRAIADLVDAIASENTLVLFVDDIQWTDDLSRRALAALVASKSRRRLLVLLTSRDREVGRLFARVSERALVANLGPLPQDSARAVVRRVVECQDDAADNELVDWLADASGGNPFFLRSLIGHFQASGERFVVPSTLSSLLDQQLAALGMEATAMLSACVALGRNATIHRIVETLELPHIQFQVAIRELEVSHLIAQHEEQIRPAHWLVAEASTRATSPIAFRALHRRIAVVLEPHAIATGASTELWDCAEHWIVAGDDNRAVGILRTCADQSLEIGRPREAAETLLRAAALAPKTECAAIVSRAAELADQAGENALLLRAVALAEGRGVVIQYEGSEVAEMLVRTSEWHASKDFVERLKPWLRPDVPIRLRLKAAMTLLVLADIDDAPSVAEDSVGELVAELGSAESDQSTDALKVLLIYHSAFGDVPESVRVAESLLDRAKSLDPVDAARLQRLAGVALFRAGYVEPACDALQESYSNARIGGLTQLQYLTSNMLASFYYDRGEDETSARWLDIAEQFVAELGDYQSAIHQICVRTDIACANGDARTARESLKKGLQIMPVDVAARNRRWFRALELRVQQLEGKRIDLEAAITALTGHHIRGQEARDIADFEVATALHIMLDRGLVQRALELFDRFVREYRRGDGTLSRGLQNIVKQMGWMYDPTLFRGLTPRQ